MFSFLKQKIKGSDLGLGFFESIQRARLAGFLEKEELFPQGAEIGLEEVKNEWLYLDIFTVDLAVFLALGQTPEKEAVLTTFWREVKKWLQHEKVNALPERISFLNLDPKVIPAENSESSLDRLMRRMHQYSDCINKPHRLGENHIVAATFTSLCGSMDGVIIIGISAFFSSQKAGLVKMVNSYRIIP